MIAEWQMSGPARLAEETFFSEVEAMCALACAMPGKVSVIEALEGLRGYYMASFEPGAARLAFDNPRAKDAVPITAQARELRSAAYALSCELNVDAKDILVWMKQIFTSALNKYINERNPALN